MEWCRFLDQGKGGFVSPGPDFDFMKEKFSWLRATCRTIERRLKLGDEGNDSLPCGLAVVKRPKFTFPPSPRFAR